MILVNDAKYIDFHFVPIFSTSSSPFTLQAWVIQKSIEFYLFRNKCWLNHLSNLYIIQFDSVYKYTV